MGYNNYWLEGIIDRFEGEEAVIILGNQKLFWPRKNLPPDAREGLGVKLSLSTEEQIEQTSEEMAKKILNEILKTNHD